MSTPFPFNPNEGFEEIEDGSFMGEDGIEFESEPIEELSDEEESQLPPADFFGNLAEDIEETKLNTLCQELLQGIKDDLQSRSQWETTCNRVLKQIGFTVEDVGSDGFVQLCNAYDTTLSTALVRYFSTAMPELFPSKGPVQAKVLGIETADKSDQAERIESFLNYYLKYCDLDYYKDSERLLMHVGFFGCGFRKVYQDPLYKRPTPRFVRPQDFIVDNNTLSLLESSRMTQVVRLSRRDVLLRQREGVYIEFDLPTVNDDDSEEMGEKSPTVKTINKMEGVDTSGTENKSLFTFYEVYADLNLKGDELAEEGDTDEKRYVPKPYIVTICVATKKIVSIRRNWRENDGTFAKIQYFVHYYYLPGFGIYGLGLAHLIGTNAITLSSLLRQLINAGIFKNFPAGMMVKGLKIENNDKALMPGEFKAIETGTLPIQQAVMPMPYDEPSQVLNQLRMQLIEQTQSLASSAEMKVSELSQNAPVGTTLAVLEVNNVIQSTVLRGNHNSLTQELRMIFDLFKEYLEDEPYPFLVRGKESYILKSDFNENVEVLPVSDPNVMTNLQRVMRAETLLKLAESHPDIYNIREISKRMCIALGIDNMEAIFNPEAPPPQPLDPVTENMNLIQGKPVKAAMWQNHPAHMATHAMVDPQQYPQSAAQVAAHNQEHQAMQYLIDMMTAMGIQMPDEQQLMQPDVQNEIAARAAEIAQQQQEAMQQQMQAEQPLDPNMVMMADIEQRKEKTMMDAEIAELKAEVEAMKAQLKFESERAKIEADLEMASEKNAVDLEIAHSREINQPHGEF